MSHPIHQHRRALDAAEITTELARLNDLQAPGWQLVDGALEKTFGFRNFYETMGFVNAVAFIANTEDHHPDMALGYSRCTVRFNTHDVNGISVSDFFCASKVDALLA